MSENQVQVQKPQLEIMSRIQNTPPFQVAVTDFVKDKFIKNYNLTHGFKPEDVTGELVYQRQLIFFQQFIAESEALQKVDPFSLYQCLLTLSVKDWSLDPLDNEVYMYARAGKAVLQPQAGSYVKRLRDTRQILGADQPQIVYKEDIYLEENGRVLKHVRTRKSDEMIAGYVRFILKDGTDRFFIYEKSDWEAWKKKSPQRAGDNWAGNNQQPQVAFLKTKLVLHAAKEKCWASGTKTQQAEEYPSVIVDEDELNQLPEPPQNASYQPSMVVTPAGEVEDNSFVQSEQKDPAATVVYKDDDF